MLNDVNPLFRTDIPFPFDVRLVRAVPTGKSCRMYVYVHLGCKVRHFWTTYNPLSKLDEDIALRNLFGRANAFLDSLKPCKIC